jgi:cytochrome c oxidase subunit 3
MLAFLAMLATIAAWWLAQQGLTAKPWLEQGVPEAVPAGCGAPRSSRAQTAKLGLGLFLAVAGALFVLLISGYFMRKGLPDWRPLPMPPLVFVTTGVLAASSVFLGLAWRFADRDSREDAKLALFAGGAAAIVFVAGQLAAWRQMLDGGFGVAGNPSNTFFYLLTGVHAVHVLGGLAALAWTFAKMRRSADFAATRARIELCSVYWDFLLVVWLVLLAILTGFADGLGEICGRLLS